MNRAQPPASTNPCMELDSRLKNAALTLSGLIKICPLEHLGDLLDLIAGAVASLLKAQELEYKDEDRVGKALPDNYYPKLAERVKRMADGTLPPRGRWISGYYFNSALLRLGASRAIAREFFKKIDKLNGTDACNLRDTKVDDIYEEYRKLKHFLRALRTGRNVTFHQAVDSISELIAVFERRREQLSDPRTKFPLWKDRAKNG